MPLLIFSASGRVTAVIADEQPIDGVVEGVLVPEAVPDGVPVVDLDRDEVCVGDPVEVRDSDIVDEGVASALGDFEAEAPELRVVVGVFD